MYSRAIFCTIKFSIKNKPKYVVFNTYFLRGFLNNNMDRIINLFFSHLMMMRSRVKRRPWRMETA